MFTSVERIAQRDAPVVALRASAAGIAVLYRDGQIGFQENQGRTFVSLAPTLPDIVSAMAFTPDDKLVFGTARYRRPALARVGILDPRTGEVESFFEGLSDEEEQGIAGVASSPDGASLFACGGDNQVCAWSREGVLLWKQDLYKWPYAIDVSPDGQTVLVASWEGYVWGWDTQSGESRRWPERYFGGPVFGAVFLPSGSDILVGTDAGDPSSTLLWNVGSDEIRYLVGHSDQVHALAVARDGVYLVTGSLDATVRVWDPAGTSLATLDLVLDASLTGTCDGSVTWPPYAGWRSRETGNPAAVHAVALAPGRDTVLIGTRGGAVLRARIERGAR